MYALGIPCFVIEKDDKTRPRFPLYSPDPRLIQLGVQHIFAWSLSYAPHQLHSA